MSKVDNSERFGELKLELRREVLSRIRPAAVLDLCAGVLGKQWCGAWREAATYLGVERRQWRSDEPHRRVICDNREVAEKADLSRFNVFDFDTYGEPWTLATIVARRRAWARGERGSFVFTDGGERKLHVGNTIFSLEALLPMHPDIETHKPRVAEELHRQAVGALLALMRAQPTWFSMGGGHTGRGAEHMYYSAVAFEGAG